MHSIRAWRRAFAMVSSADRGGSAMHGFFLLSYGMWHEMT